MQKSWPLRSARQCLDLEGITEEDLKFRSGALGLQAKREGVKGRCPCGNMWDVLTPVVTTESEGLSQLITDPRRS